MDARSARFSLAIGSKRRGGNADLNATFSPFDVRGESIGNRPNQGTPPISQIAFSVSAFGSPINAIPRMLIWRLRKASIDKRE